MIIHEVSNQRVHGPLIAVSDWGKIDKPLEEWSIKGQWSEKGAKFEVNY